MAIKDPEQRRAYHREYARVRRAAVCQTRRQPLRQPASPELTAVRVRTARDVLLLLEEQIQLVRAANEATTIERARTIGFLAGVALRAVEAADLAGRVEALEMTLGQRKEGSL